MTTIRAQSTSPGETAPRRAEASRAQDADAAIAVAPVQPEPAPVPRPAAAPPPPPEPDPAPVAITSLRFHIDEETGKTIVSVVDPSTGQVVRQIPSEEALALARHLGDAHGVLVNLKA